MIFHSLTFARSRGGCWKPRAKPEVFNTSRGILRMLMNGKIMFDRYHCINSKITHRKLRKCLRTLFFSHTTIFLRAHAFYKYPRIGPWPGTFSHDDLKALHALCVAAQRVSLVDEFDIKGQKYTHRSTRKNWPQIKAYYLSCQYSGVVGYEKCSVIL